MTLVAGQRLDHKYWLLHTLVQGGFGEVWLPPCEPAVCQ